VVFVPDGNSVTAEGDSVLISFGKYFELLECENRLADAGELR
jgi:hypothetical protein